MSKVKDNEFLIPCGDWNGHIDWLAEGFHSRHTTLYPEFWGQHFEDFEKF